MNNSVNSAKEMQKSTIDFRSSFKSNQSDESSPPRLPKNHQIAIEKSSLKKGYHEDHTKSLPIINKLEFPD